MLRALTRLQHPGTDGSMHPRRQLSLVLAAGFLACFHANAQNADSPQGPTDLEVSGEKTSQSERLPINFQVLAQRKINLGNRFIIMNRVVPPVLPEPPPPPPPPTAEELAAMQAAAALWRPLKKYEILFLSATVYDRRVTEIRWFDNQRQYKVFSNIDFNFLAGVNWFETEDTEYMLLMGLGNETSEQAEAFNQRILEQGLPKYLRKEIPSPTEFSSTRSEYAVVEDEQRTAPADWELTALDALHVFYDANKTRLAEEYVKREAENSAREQWLKDHPPFPKNTIINFWIEEPKGQQNPRKRSKLEAAQ